MFLTFKRGIISNSLYLIVLLIMFSPASAHGLGKQMVIEEDAGPYTVSVWLDPTETTIHETSHITVSVSYNAQILQGAEVIVGASQVDGSSTINTTATHEEAINKLFYESQLDFAETGEWLIEVDVTGKEGTGSVDFTVSVTDEKSLPIEWMVSGAVFVVIVIGGAAYELRKRARNED